MTESRQDDRPQCTFEDRSQWKKTDEKYWIKRWQVDRRWWWIWQLASDVQSYGNVQWETKTNVRQTDTKCMPWFIRVCIEDRLWRNEAYVENKRCAETLDIYCQIHPLVCHSAEHFYRRTEKTSAQRFETKTEDMRTTPHKAMGVGSLTTIDRASKY